MPAKDTSSQETATSREPEPDKTDPLNKKPISVLGPNGNRRPARQVRPRTRLRLLPLQESASAGATSRKTDPLTSLASNSARKRNQDFGSARELSNADPLLTPVEAADYLRVSNSFLAKAR